MKIAAAGNTEIPAYLALVAKGFDTSRTPSETGSEERWIADNGQDKFLAAGPLELLGLVALVEERGENWRASDEEIEEFLTKYNQS